MNVSASSNASLAPLLLRLEQDASATAQEQTRGGSVRFQQTLAETEAAMDTMELTTPQPSAEPTTSALFQSHLGAFGPGTARMDAAALPEEQTPLRVSGISAAVAASPFAGEQSLASHPFQEALRESASAQGSVGVAGSEDFSGIYDARTGQIIHRVGARLDVKG